MMKCKLLFILVFSLFTFTASFSQYSLFALSYNTSLPLGETNDFINSYSWRGVSAEWRWFIQEQVSAGIFFGWNVFHEKVSGNFVDGTLAYSATQLRTINAFPMLATGHYYFGDEFSFRPYVGLGVGTYRTWQRTTTGILQDNEIKRWQFGLAPSVGATIPIRSGVMANVEVRYNYAFKAGPSLNNSYLGINVGLAWDTSY